MSLSPYNPKVSLLEKLAGLVRYCEQGFFDGDERHTAVMQIVSDPEILAWYDSMAELQHVPPRRGVPAIHNAALTLAIEDRLKADPVVVESTQGRIYNNTRQGYQIFATKSVHHEAEDIASYTEATSVDEALHKCIQQFPVEEGYTGHGVKDIETQVVTMLSVVTEQTQPESPLCLSLED